MVVEPLMLYLRSIKAMLNFKVKRTSFFLVCLCGIGFFVRCANPAPAKKIKITKEEAIKKAQQFLIEQGYTSLSPSINKFKFEKGEFATDTFKIIGYRKNTVNKQPFEVKEHSASITVGFQYVNKENNIGRAVTMDTLGINIIMQAKEVRLDWFLEED